MKSLLSIITVLAVTLAGCAGEDSPPPPATAPESTASSAEAAAPMTTTPAADSTLQLPAAALVALQAHAPKFARFTHDEYDPRVHEWMRPPHNMPVFKTSSDMNADGVVDVALFGHDGTAELLLVLLSDGPHYRLVEVRRAPLAPANERPKQTHYLEPAPEGRTGFMETIEGEAGVLYYWQNGRFEEEVTGD